MKLFPDAKKHTAIVFGAGGFIGSHLVDALVKEGFGVVLAVASYHSTGKTGLVPTYPNVKTIRGDIRDQHFLEYMKYKAINQHTGGSICVFNCAAHISVPASMNLPNAYLETNVLAVSRMLQVFSGPKYPFVQVSTSEVFDGRAGVYSDKSALTPISPYGGCKAMSEMLVRSWRALYGSNSIACRLFNTYGPRQSPRAVIPKMILEAMDVKEKIKSKVMLGDPNTYRSFMYVKDSARALLAAAAIAMRGDGPPVVQVGASEATRIGDVWPLVASVVGIGPFNPYCVSWDESARDEKLRVPALRGKTSREIRELVALDTMKLLDGIKETYKWLNSNRSYYSELDYQ